MELNKMYKFKLYSELCNSALFRNTVVYGTTSGVRMIQVRNGEMVDFNFLATNTDGIEVWFSQFEATDCKVCIADQSPNWNVYYNGSFMDLTFQNVDEVNQILPIVNELINIRVAL